VRRLRSPAFVAAAALSLALPRSARAQPDQPAPLKDPASPKDAPAIDDKGEAKPEKAPTATPPAPSAVPAPPPPPSSPPARPLPGPADAPAAPPPGGFEFGSYGRVVAATDLHGQPGHDADVVAHGSRLDEGNYVELELRREDYWKKTQSTTRLVATLAFADPFFHYDGQFSIQAAVRNLYIEERDLLVKGLSVWAGSRMYRGDDIYLLDWWPLDNLNTMGAGVRYDAPTHTTVALHVGVEQPASGFFKQIVPEASVYDQPGETDVAVLNRQEAIGSLRLQQIVPLGKDGLGGLKGVLYGEYHTLAEGQEQTSVPNVFQDMPAESGVVIGAQLGAFTGVRDTHVNLFLRYATGIAAYPDLTEPFELSPQRTTSGAHEALAALGANYEVGAFGVMLAGYIRSFRDASPALDYDDVDEGIVMARPAVFFGEIAGLAFEASYQAQQRGVVTRVGTDGTLNHDPAGPVTARIGRIGFMPFLSPAGRGNYSRPQFRIIYSAAFRNDAAKTLYPLNDVAGLRSVEHFLGVGAEWWFNSTSYGGS
jgi:maltoporin